MKLYSDMDGSAPSPRRVRMYLAEKGIYLPIEKLELHKENRTDAFREKNPMRTLPVLELDDGSHLSESIAICRYFEEVHPDPPLFGTGARERAEVEMWSRRVEWNVYLPIDLAPYFSSKPGAATAGAEFAEGAKRSARFFDKALANREFLVGGRLTIADIFLFGALDYGLRHAGFAIAPELETLRAWYEAMAARPSAKA